MEPVNLYTEYGVALWDGVRDIARPLGMPVAKFSLINETVSAVVVRFILSTRRIRTGSCLFAAVEIFNHDIQRKHPCIYMLTQGCFWTKPSLVIHENTWSHCRVRKKEKI